MRTACKIGDLLATSILALMLVVPLVSSGADLCIAAGSYSSLSDITLRNASTVEDSKLSISGKIYTRTLKSGPDTYWIGYQFQDVTLDDGSAVASPVFYTVPFAVQIERSTGQVKQEVINASLKDDGEARLLSLYDIFHSIPSDLLQSGEAVIALERDRLGVVRTRYSSPELGGVTRERLAYAQLAPDQQGLLKSVEIEKDSAFLKEFQCGFRALDGEVKTKVTFNTGTNVETHQRNVIFLQKRQEIPPELRLAQLGEDPLNWPPMSLAEIYPPPERLPLASAEIFLNEVGKLWGADSLDREALIALLFNNDQYLMALRPNLANGTYSGKFERQLLLRLGQASTKNSRELLGSIIIDDLIDPNTRFGSIMGLRYTKDPLEQNITDSLFEYANQSNLGDVDQDLADSTLLTLGTISGTTADATLNRRLIDRLAGAASTRDTLLTMTALGNSRMPSAASAIGYRLDDQDPIIRERAAESLGQIEGSTTKQLLSSRLEAETEPTVLSSVIRSLGKSPLSFEELSPLIARTDLAQPLPVRQAAIGAIANQAENLPEAKEVLRKILPSATDRTSVETIMRALYATD